MNLKKLIASNKIRVIPFLLGMSFLLSACAETAFDLTTIKKPVLLNSNPFIKGGENYEVVNRDSYEGVSGSVSTYIENKIGNSIIVYTADYKLFYVKAAETLLEKYDAIIGVGLYAKNADTISQTETIIKAKGKAVDLVSK